MLIKVPMSGILNSESFESELNSIVKEYLDYSGYDQTSTVFTEECESKGKPDPNTSLNSVRTSSGLQNVQRKLVTYFKTGNREDFMSLWSDQLSERIRSEDTVAQKLEFYLHIYFAIYPIKHNPDDKEAAEESMMCFRRYLETRGAALSQTTEFLPFYALPYVPNPRSHPSYKELFSEHWVPDLDLRLNRYLQLALDSVAQPRLFELYKGKSSKDTANSKKMQAQILENERRTAQYMRRHNRVQADYHNLIGITAELVDTLEACLQGKSVSPEYLQQICTRLFASQNVQHVSVDLSRPGTAAQVLRQSIQTNKMPNQDRSEYLTANQLDFTKINADLQNSSDRQKSTLLQALRWRLTKTSVEERDNNLISYITNDLLGCSQPGPHMQAILNILVSDDPLLRQVSARMFNAVASLCRGRSYLSQNTELLKAIFENLKKETIEGSTRENSIGVLQKLSLRRPMQTGMIQMGLIDWLIELLEDNDSLSDYSLEYSVALLMNLCLRTSGKRMCIPNASKILKVLSDLLGHENKEIFPYVNGALYSILAIPSIREEAKAMEMEDTLKCFVKDDQPDMNRQLDFVMKQLNSTDEPDGSNSDDDEDDDDEQEITSRNDFTLLKEDQDVLEPDLDKDENIRISSANINAISGDDMLRREYARNSNRGGLSSRGGKRVSGTEEPLTRPVTPGQRGLRSGLSTMHEVSDVDRPPTRSGSRPNTRGGAIESNDIGQGDEEPRPDLALNDVSPTPSETSSGKKATRTGGLRMPPEYQQAFSSRPKIPRTPDPSALRSGSEMVNQSQTLPLKPTYSDRMPTSSRPNSAINRPTSGGKQSSTHR